MQLSMSIRVSQGLILHLNLVGGSTGESETIFPLVEERIHKSTKAQLAFAAIEEPRDCGYDCYRSFMDFLVGSIWPEAQPLIFRFYDDAGLPLRRQITETGRASMEIFLLGAMEAALLAYDNHLTIDWAWMRRVLSFLTHDLPTVRVYANGVTPLIEVADCAA